MLRSSLRNLAHRGLPRRARARLARGRSTASRSRASRCTTTSAASTGPFDVIGDVHGCYGELCALLDRLGYAEPRSTAARCAVIPDGRRAIFLGDLVDRGPGIVETLRLVMDMVAAGSALCVPGNHEMKLLRKLNGRNVNVSHGLAETLAQLDALPEPERDAFTADVRAFLDGLVSHYWLDGGKLVVAHAGLREEMQGRGSGAVREFALYGETTGETDEFGLPVRFDWASEYRGNGDRRVRPHAGAARGVGEQDDLRRHRLRLRRRAHRAALSGAGDRVGRRRARVRRTGAPARAAAGARSRRRRRSSRRTTCSTSTTSPASAIIATRLLPHVTIPAENAAAALEVMSRWCVDPRWLIYLPPTMSPSETSAPRGPARASRRGVRVLPPRRRRARRAGGEAHGQPRRRRARARRGRRAPPLRRRHGRARRRAHAHGPRVLRRTRR